MNPRNVEQDVGRLIAVHARAAEGHVAEIKRLERLIEQIHGGELVRCSGPCRRIMDLLDAEQCFACQGRLPYYCSRCAPDPTMADTHMYARCGNCFSFVHVDAPCFNAQTRICGDCANTN